MRASFRDLDPMRLEEDELIRLHGSHLIRQKWTGARHSYFNSGGTASCGNFFEGPISERCVEFAEYDSNLYCLANLISTRSSNGGFKLELIKDAVPGCVLAVAHAEGKGGLDDELDLSLSHSANSSTRSHQRLMPLVAFARFHASRIPHHSLGELSEASFSGNSRWGMKLTFGLPISRSKNVHSGAVASTLKPGQ